MLSLHNFTESNFESNLIFNLLFVCLSASTSHCQRLMMYFSDICVCVMVRSPPETKQHHEFSTPLEESCKAWGRLGRGCLHARARRTRVDGVTEEGISVVSDHMMNYWTPFINTGWTKCPQDNTTASATCARLFDSHIWYRNIYASQ
jgi:hypothetical protein